MVKAVLTVFMMIIFITSSSQADSNIVNTDSKITNYDPYKGWFWYKNPPVKKKDETKKDKKGFVIKTYTYKQLWNMYPDEFQKTLNFALRQAVQKPTTSNVKQYLILQDIARRKAYAFSNVVGYVNQSTPKLNVYKDYPENAPGIRMRTGLIDYSINSTLQRNRNDYALLFFYKPGCQYCEIESQILKSLQDELGWDIMPINISKKYRAAVRFDVTTVPELILIHKGSPKWIPVATGVVALNIVKRNIYRGIMYFKGNLSPENWSIYQFQKEGSFNVKNPPVNENAEFKIKMREK